MNKIATSGLVGLSLLVLGAANLAAQTCVGTAPFSAGNMRGGVGIRLPDNATIFDGEFAVSAKSGLYGGATVSLLDPNGPFDSSLRFGGFIGKPMMVDAKKTVEMCPQAFLWIGENSTNSFGGGVSFGRSFEQSTFTLVPFGAASLHRDDFGTLSDFNLDLDFGAGFVLNKKWTIRPSLNLPLTNSGQIQFRVMGFLNFGSM